MWFTPAIRLWLDAQTMWHQPQRSTKLDLCTMFFLFFFIIDSYRIYKLKPLAYALVSGNPANQNGIKLIFITIQNLNERYKQWKLINKLHNRLIGNLIKFNYCLNEC